MSALLSLTLVSFCAAARSAPQPLAFWALQEPTGSPRVSTGSAAPISLIDGNASHPIPTVTVPGGAPFGSYASHFEPAPGNNSARLFASRADAPAITSGIGGPNATVTLIAFVSLLESSGQLPEGLVAGVWDEFGVEGGSTGARQYAIFTNLGKCASSVTNNTYHGGLAAHLSPVGGPTPGQRFCITAACDPRELAPNAWHCFANVYDGEHIYAYVNGTLIANGDSNPYPLEGGIFSPRGLPGRIGAEFGVGANRINSTVGGPPQWSNKWAGLIGGIAVWDRALSGADVRDFCNTAAGFGDDA